MLEQSPQAETLIEIHGYVTDPKQVGYQILNNYENLYWATLVGPVAWRMYELLRGFCHQDNNVVETTVSFLTSALGLDDRRALIGRVKKVKGKEYLYPGLIEILQRERLIIAEEVGSGPTMKYRFHVDRTPGLLTDEQVSVLPEIIRHNHETFLQRHQEKIRLLEAKKRQSKIASLQEAQSDEELGGMGNSQRGMGNSQGGYGKFPYKQQHINNNKNNNTQSDAESPPASAPPPPECVALLRFRGVSEKVSQSLAARFSHEHILQKIDYFDAQEETSRGAIKNPPAYLRRAIEEDYSAPPGYKPKAEREKQRAEAERRKQLIEQSIELEEHPPARSWRDWIAEELQLPADYPVYTNRLLDELAVRLPASVYHTWTRQTMLTQLDTGHAVLAVPFDTARNELAKHRDVITAALAIVFGRQVTVDLIVLKQSLEQEAVNGVIVKGQAGCSTSGPSTPGYEREERTVVQQRMPFT
jgi:hypothetical protein